MKKLIYCAAALATALFAGSCQRELLDPAQDGSTVTFTVNIPEVATKGFADGREVINDLVYAVYKTNQETEAEAYADYEHYQLVYQVNPESKTIFTGDGKTSIELELINDQNYVILFWAQNFNAGVYNTENLLNVSYDKNVTKDYFANQGSYAAFSGRAFVSKVKGSRTENVLLKRPFAQINIATQDPEKYDVTISKTKVTVSRAGKYFNIANQTATSVENEDGTPYSVVFGAEAMPEGETLEVTIGNETATYHSLVDNKDLPESEKKNHYVAMNYIFADGNVAVAYEIETNFGTVKNTIDNVPVKANYRTNIIGNLLTSDVKYNVELDQDWGPAGNVDNDYVVEVVTVTSAADLQEAINNAPEATGTETNIKIDVEPNAQGEKILDLNEAFVGLMSTKAGETAQKNYGIQIPATKSIVLDLNGCTIKQELECTTGYAMIENNGTLKIVGGGTLKFGDITTTHTKDLSYASNTICNNGTLIVEDATIVNSSSENVATYGFPHCIDTNGELIINGGTLTNETLYSTIRIWTSNNDPTKCKVTIDGGTFNGSIDFQGHNNNYATIPHYGTLTINGGTFNATKDDSYAFRVLRMAVNVEDMDAIIKGGHFNGKVGVRNYSSSTDNPAVISIVGGTFRDDPSEFVPAGYPVENTNGIYTIGEYTPVAKIGKVEYATLKAAVDAVQDGETITLIADETFTAYNYYDNGGWKDGLGYSGDQSFTIDLNGFTIKQNGALNDYLVWLKNDGTKANTITFKNGTMDAGTTAYCALCTASSHVNKLTVNLENITLINNKSDGSTVKIRAGSELNVKDETKIIGKDSYLGIENWNAVVNIYDGAEIYMNGTTSYNGCLVGVGGNGTVNVYGGYGKGVSGGLIAMTSGGTINAMGGEWIANTDGTFANSNKSVLVAQSDKQYNAGAGNAVVNVTGGTYKGGYNCYGNAVGDAQINISGGNFNADPRTYLADGCEANKVDGIWTVRVLPVARIGETEYETLEKAAAAAKAGDTITVLRDATLSAELTLPASVTLNGNGKQINGTIYAGGDLTFAGHTKVTAFSASYYDRVITIGEGACLEVTGTGRVSLAYGNTFNITGSIENANTADKANVQPSLIIPGGISITGGSDAAMNVENAYVVLGDTSSKNSSANGTFNLNFTNSIAEFTNQFTFAEPTSGKNPTFKVKVTDSVLTTNEKLCIAAPNTEFVVDNSIVTSATYIRNSGALEIKNKSVVTGSTIQFGENGGNNGTITVDDSTLTINASSTGHAFDGKDTGSITLTNGAKATVTYYKAMTIEYDGTSTFTGTEVK